MVQGQEQGGTRTKATQKGGDKPGSRAMDLGQGKVGKGERKEWRRKEYASELNEVWFDLMHGPRRARWMERTAVKVGGVTSVDITASKPLSFCHAIVVTVP